VGRKYIVDISGNLPTILCEIDTADGSLKKSYLYADGRILMQKDYENPANVHKTYWHVHDWLGSIRQVLAYHKNSSLLNIVHSYGCTPFRPLDAGLCSGGGVERNSLVYLGGEKIEKRGCFARNVLFWGARLPCSFLSDA